MIDMIQCLVPLRAIRITAAIAAGCGIASIIATMPAFGAEPGSAVVVVYNSKIPESKQVAEHYATRRQIPATQVFGFDLPEGETLTRKEFRSDLQEPLLKRLESARLLVFGQNRSRREEAETPPLPVSASFRYLTLCYGVPLKIAPEPRLNEDDVEKLRTELRRNEASVDSELALLPLSRFKAPLYGVVANRGYSATNAAMLNPTNGVLMVARLDGPSAAIARGLVDKAIEAERNGLWGRAYFDARGITNGNAKVGDEWIQASATIARRLGFETTLDERDERFGVTFPMSHIALYAGWYEYDGQVSGPFTRPEVEFMPGAFAYHLHSFSAASLRSAVQHWVGPLLAKGATASMGTVYEPYLEFTPHLPTFFHRWIHLGFSFGEAAYASQPFLSWQTTVVGDPLYRPFETKPQQLHERLIQSKSKLAEWSQLKAVNINQQTGLPHAELIAYLESLPELNKSAVLLEKLATLYFARTRFDDSIATYQKALAQSSPRQQRIRITLRLAQLLELANRRDEAAELHAQFAKDFPDYAPVTNARPSAETGKQP